MGAVLDDDVWCDTVSCQDSDEEYFDSDNDFNEEYFDRNDDTDMWSNSITDNATVFSYPYRSATHVLSLYIDAFWKVMSCWRTTLMLCKYWIFHPMTLLLFYISILGWDTVDLFHQSAPLPSRSFRRARSPMSRLRWYPRK